MGKNTATRAVLLAMEMMLMELVYHATMDVM
jgi:hypothetical protein